MSMNDNEPVEVNENDNELPGEEPTRPKKTPPPQFHDPFSDNNAWGNDEPIVTFDQAISSEDAERLSDEIAKNQDSIAQALRPHITERWSDSGNHHTAVDLYQEFMERGNITQVPEIDGSKLVINSGKVSLASLRGKTKLSGRAAVSLVNSITGTGNSTVIYCWHSGIRLVLEGITRYAVLQHIAMMIHTQEVLGMNALRSMFSAYDSYLNTEIVNWILEHVTSSNVKGANNETLKGLILTHDMNLLAIGALNSRYPTGYPIDLACAGNLTGDCDHRITPEKNEATGEYKADRLLTFSKMVWVDNSKFSPEDLRILTAKDDSVSVKEITAYQGRHLPDRMAGPINEDKDGLIYLKMRHPTIKEYEASSRKWIVEVESAAKAILSRGGYTREENFKQYIKLLEHMGELNDHLSNIAWIDGVQIRRDDESIDIDRESVPEVLRSLGREEDRKNINDAIQHFKSKAVTAAVGLPNYKCPKCKNPMGGDSEEIRSIIPRNPFSYFFTIGESQLKREQDKR